MAADIFEFWSMINRGDKIHPSDKRAFERMEPERHGFILDCLPACFAGPLKSAKVVLLYLSPGYEEGEERLTDETVEKYVKRWSGKEPLHDHHWFKSRTKVFGDFDKLKDKLAVLNIGAYHSKNMKSYGSMLALPSSRVSLDWAQNVLFDEAEKRKRIVICMRSPGYWGLEAGKDYEGSLYAPMTVRSGFLRRERDANNEMVERVCKELGTQPNWGDR